MIFLFFSIAFVALLGQSLAANCPNIPLKDFNDFDFNSVIHTIFYKFHLLKELIKFFKYLGRWYQVAGRPAFDRERSLQCFYADITKTNETAYSIIYRATDM